MTSNIADQFADKTIDSIISNNQKDATKFWSQLLNHAKQTSGNRTNELLSTIVMNSYSGKRSNFYPLLEFVLKNNVTDAFPKLYDTLDFYNHIFDGQEIFVLAHYLRETCGDSTLLYEKIPSLVKKVITGPLLFRNKLNSGYIIATAHSPCTTLQDCFGNPKTEAFMYRTGPSTMKVEDVIKNQRAHWKFVLPITMDMKSGFNGTRMAWGFHLKNVAEKMFLITKLRMTTFFLRNNTIFDSYYANELQCQYQPMLVKGGDGLKIALVEKYIPKTEFVHGGNWGKKGDRLNLGRRAQLRGETDGLIWDISSPPSSDNNDTEENEMDDDNGRTSSSKCQF
jgi:hypothetical protein